MRKPCMMFFTACVAVAATSMVVFPAWTQSTKKTSDNPPPDVTGAWTGIWWSHPFKPMAPKAGDLHKRHLDCTVTRKGIHWQARFQGECSRPYKFEITMEGRQAGGAVLFRGTSDLGEKNGGVYDWIGRATQGEFVGFYTSATHVGEFRLERNQ